jgi:predicted AAA+ superfamily ATPase
MQVVTGARQVGKTTLVTQIVKKAHLAHVFASADEPTLRGLGWIDAQWKAARLLLRDTGERGALLVLDEVQRRRTTAAPSSTRSRRRVRSTSFRA